MFVDYAKLFSWESGVLKQAAFKGSESVNLAVASPNLCQELGLRAGLGARGFALTTKAEPC